MVICPIRVRTQFHLDEEVVRELRGKGEVLVKKGQKVNPQEVIARVEVGSEPMVFDLPRLLKAKKPFSKKHLLKKVGEKVKKGERLVSLQSFLFGKRILIAPCSGQIRELKENSGELVFLPETKKEVAVPSLFWGEVAGVGKEEVVITAQFRDVFGVLGSGQAFGKLIPSGGEENYLSFLNQEDPEEAIFVFEESPSRATLEKLNICGAVGIICGGVHWQDFDGCQRRQLPLLVTEGLGRLKMGRDLWEVFQEYEGRSVYLEGEKKMVRIPLEKEEVKKGKRPTEKERNLKKGDKVRLIGEPGPIGIQGRVVGIGAKKTRLESGFSDLLVEVEIGEEVIGIPSNNLEIVDS